MSEQLRESLSALMDGEANAFEVRRVLDEARRDAELRKAWARWQRVSAALQGGSAQSGAGLADRVWAGLVEDAAASDRDLALPGRQRNWRRLSAWAAASAAAVAVIVATQFAMFGGGEELSTPQVVAVPGAVSRPIAPDPPKPMSGRPLPEAANVNVYMLQHMQQKAVNQPDVGAFTKLVTFEPEN